MGQRKDCLVNENELVRKIEKTFAGARTSVLELGMGDDAALLKPRAGHELVLTCDWFLEGSHFLREKHTADAVGWKCLARAVSDIAAMGGVPRCFLLSLALPASATGTWLSGFLGGLRRASKELQCELAGGDTTRREEILINVTVIGEVKKGMSIRRVGARPGDQLFVTGILGEAELGLEMLRREKGLARAKNPALRKHLYPVPRLAVGRWLAEKRLASAMMDLSDGLSTDMERLCSASGVGAQIYARKLPVSSLVGRADGVNLALHGGDDYELLFTVRSAVARKIPSEYRGVKITRVGEIVSGKKIIVERAGKKRDSVSGGWDPFGRR
jgi:thiamine-monophosphate kinase